MTVAVMSRNAASIKFQTVQNACRKIYTSRRDTFMSPAARPRLTNGKEANSLVAICRKRQDPASRPSRAIACRGHATIRSRAEWDISSLKLSDPPINIVLLNNFAARVNYRGKHGFTAGSRRSRDLWEKSKEDSGDFTGRFECHALAHRTVLW